MPDKIFQNKAQALRFLYDNFKDDNRNLLKISMCFYNDIQLSKYEDIQMPLWYAKCGGKLFYSEWAEDKDADMSGEF